MLSQVWAIGVRANPDTLLNTTVIGERESTEFPVTNRRNERVLSGEKFPIKSLKYPNTLSCEGLRKTGSYKSCNTRSGVPDKHLYKE